MIKTLKKQLNLKMNSLQLPSLPQFLSDTLGTLTQADWPSLGPHYKWPLAQNHLLTSTGQTDHHWFQLARLPQFLSDTLGTSTQADWPSLGPYYKRPLAQNHPLTFRGQMVHHCTVPNGADIAPETEVFESTNS